MLVVCGCPCATSYVKDSGWFWFELTGAVEFKLICATNVLPPESLQRRKVIYSIGCRIIGLISSHRVHPCNHRGGSLEQWKSQREKYVTLVCAPILWATQGNKRDVSKPKGFSCQGKSRAMHTDNPRAGKMFVSCTCDKCLFKCIHKGWQDGSAVQASCCQAPWPVFNP